MEERILPGQSVQGSGNGGETLDVPAVITGETEEGAHFRGCLWGRNVPDGSQERRILQESLFCHPMAQVTNLLGGECTFRRAQFELGVPQSLKHLA